MEATSLITGYIVDGLYQVAGEIYSFSELAEKYQYRLHGADVFYCFNTAEELMAYASPASRWNKEAYAAELNDAHNALFRRYYTERNYLNIGEIPHWWDDEVFGDEAHALTDWWRSTCKILVDYIDNVTEETALPVADFISNLPALPEPTDGEKASRFPS